MRSIGIKFGHDANIRKVLHLEGEEGLPGFDVPLLKETLLKKLRDDNCLDKVGANPQSTVEDVYIYRLEPEFGWDEEVGDQEVFAHKTQDLFFHFMNKQPTTGKLLS